MINPQHVVLCSSLRKKAITKHKPVNEVWVVKRCFFFLRGASRAMYCEPPGFPSIFPTLKNQPLTNILLKANANFPNRYFANPKMPTSPFDIASNSWSTSLGTPLEEVLILAHTCVRTTCYLVAICWGILSGDKQLGSIKASHWLQLDFWYHSMIQLLSSLWLPRTNALYCKKEYDLSTISACSRPMSCTSLQGSIPSNTRKAKKALHAHMFTGHPFVPASPGNLLNKFWNIKKLTKINE